MQVQALAAEIDGAMDVDAVPVEQRLAACDKLLKAVATARSVAVATAKAAATSECCRTGVGLVGQFGQGLLVDMGQRSRLTVCGRLRNKCSS